MKHMLLYGMLDIRLKIFQTTQYRLHIWLKVQRVFFVVHQLLKQ